MKKKHLLWIASFVFLGCSNDNNERVITSISLDRNEINLKIGEEIKIKALHTPSDLMAPEYIWHISDENVATIKNGVVTGKSVGEAILTVEAKVLDLKSSSNIRVIPVEAISIKLSSNEEQIKIGGNVKLQYAIEPENTTYKEVEWLSDNNVVLVAKSGEIIGMSEGEAFVSVKIKGTEISDKCKISVSPIEVTDIVLSETSITIERHREFPLSAVIQPENATNKEIKWSSSDREIATVSNGVIFGENVGKCIIYAESADGKEKKECAVEIVPVKVSDIVINGKYNILEGDNFTLSYTISPADAANKNVTITSWNSDIISVNSDGSLTANAIGSAYITVTTEDGGYAFTTNVDVNDITSFISFTFDTENLVNLNGLVTGNLYSTIRNNSTKSVQWKRVDIIDTYTQKIVAYFEVPSSIETLSNLRYGKLLVNIYKPMFLWTFQYNGEIYRMGHVF